MTFAEIFLGMYVGLGLGLDVSFRVTVGRPTNWWKHLVVIFAWPFLVLWLTYRMNKRS